MLETKFIIAVTQENGNFVAQIPQLSHFDFMAKNMADLQELVTWHLANQEEVKESALDVEFILKD
jgi:hypothetical protein